MFGPARCLHPAGSGTLSYENLTINEAWFLIKGKLGRGYSPEAIERNAKSQLLKAPIDSNRYFVLEAVLSLIGASFPSYCVVSGPIVERTLDRVLDDQVATAIALRKESMCLRSQRSNDQVQGIDENLAHKMASMKFPLESKESQATILEPRTEADHSSDSSPISCDNRLSKDNRLHPLSEVALSSKLNKRIEHVHKGRRNSLAGSEYSSTIGLNDRRSQHSSISEPLRRFKESHRWSTIPQYRSPRRRDDRPLTNRDDYTEETQSLQPSQRLEDSPPRGRFDHIRKDPAQYLERCRKELYAKEKLREKESHTRRDSIRHSMYGSGSSKGSAFKSSTSTTPSSARRKNYSARYSRGSTSKRQMPFARVWGKSYLETAGLPPTHGEKLSSSMTRARHNK